MAQDAVARWLENASRIRAFGSVRIFGHGGVQVDEIWSFTYAKQKNVERAKAAPSGTGDTWTWTALDADAKLIVSWLVGGRDAGTTTEFTQELAGRLANHVQLTSDGNRLYLSAVEGCLRCLLLVMCTHPVAKEALTLHLARSEGHERYFGCNLMHRNVLASSHQHLMAEAPPSHDQEAPTRPAQGWCLEVD